MVLKDDTHRAEGRLLNEIYGDEAVGSTIVIQGVGEVAIAWIVAFDLAGVDTDDPTKVPMSGMSSCPRMALPRTCHQRGGRSWTTRPRSSPANVAGPHQNLAPAGGYFLLSVREMLAPMAMDRTQPVSLSKTVTSSVMPTACQWLSRPRLGAGSRTSRL